MLENIFENSLRKSNYEDISYKYFFEKQIFNKNNAYFRKSFRRLPFLPTGRLRPKWIADV